MSPPRQTHKHTLERFGHFSVSLADLLKEGYEPTDEERLTIENHVLVVQLALALSEKRSKRHTSAASRYE